MSIKIKIKIKLRDKNIISPQIQSKYDVNRGFMLANPYSPEKIDVIGWWHSEKYDGVRAIWTGTNFYTRNLTKIIVPDWLKDQLSPNISLDGEFFIKRNYFNQTSGIIRRKTPSDYEWTQMSFMVFDCPGHPGTLEERYAFLTKVFRTTTAPHIKLVTQTPIKTLEHLTQLHQDLVDQGAEGSIIRHPHKTYTPTRSDYILKIKEQRDEDAIITGWQEGKGKNQGKLGSLWVTWTHSALIEFRVGSGFTDFDRCAMTDAKTLYPKGMIIKVAFNGLQDSGKPRHPVFRGIREL